MDESFLSLGFGAKNGASVSVNNLDIPTRLTNFLKVLLRTIVTGIEK
ncbi:uncharacterized protein METZ01_LOCUS340250 [marine metagenome]|uniref:Uncharacterized protein n=1 Tax=marine metagenome TaxID=408172 RepID=A0A382QPN0_9ZZZZ